MLAALILAAAAQVMTSSAPPLPPAEAAAILRACTTCLSNRTGATTPPPALPSVVIRSAPTSGPLGAFPPFPPSRPLNCCSAYVNGHPASLEDAARAIDLARLYGPTTQGNKR